MSDFLSSIVKNKNQTADTMIVFVDIVSYSKRRSQSQAAVINRFIACLKAALVETAKEFYDYSEKNGVSFQTDVITLPTGDGAAVCFPFEGLHDVHLFFAKSILREVWKANKEDGCEKFFENRWCNCHASFDLTVGVSVGKCIVYRDANGHFNLAGSPINLAARVMGAADGQQIAFSEDAYRQLIDLVEDPHMDEKFRRYDGIRFKHDLKLNLYHYVGDGEEYLEQKEPEILAMSVQRDRIEDAMKKMGMPLPTADDLFGKDRKREMMGMLEGLIDQMGSIQRLGAETKGEE